VADSKEGKIKKGGNVVIYIYKLMIMKRKDKKDVYLMSTTHDGKLVQSRVRDQDIKKPKVVVDYNSIMGIVDMSDA
jgi:ribosomal protein S1